MSEQRIRNALHTGRPVPPEGFETRSDDQLLQLIRDGKPKIKRNTLLSIAVALTILLGTVTALAASVDEVNALLYQLWPEVARALRPVYLSTEHDGIRLEVLSASLEDDTLLITYSLTDLEGDRINEKTSCFVSAELPGTGGTSGSYQLLSYDAEKHQAIFAAYMEYMPAEMTNGTISVGAEKIQFQLTSLFTPVETELDLWPLMADMDYKAEKVSAPSGLGIERIILDDSYSADNSLQQNLPGILNPKNNLHIPIADQIELSGIGWIDGMLHVQIHLSENWKSVENDSNHSILVRYGTEIRLQDHAGNDVLSMPEFLDLRLKNVSAFYKGLTWQDGNDTWIEKIFPVQQDELDQYQIHAVFTEYQRIFTTALHPGEGWQITFPTNMIQMASHP